MPSATENNWKEHYKSLTKFREYGISADALAIVAALFVLSDELEYGLHQIEGRLS